MTTLVAEANRTEDQEGVLVVLDRSGDTRHTWDRNSPDDVATMRALFDKLTSEGKQAWSVTRKGNKDQRIIEFDPEAEKIIFAPALVGG